MKSFVKNDFNNLIVDFIKFCDKQIVHVYNNNNYIVAKYILIDIQKFEFILTKKIIERFRLNSRKLFQIVQNFFETIYHFEFFEIFILVKYFHVNFLVDYIVKKNDFNIHLF